MDRGGIPRHILDDLCSRFVLNVPDEYKHDPIRIFFQVELAHWFYLDYYCANQAELRQCSIKDFSAQLFRHCPSLKARADGVETMLQEWKAYKQHVPTYGAVLVDPLLEQCLLVQGFYSKNTWGFPKGKVNEGEAPDDCAIREVLEETGFDIRGRFHQEDYIEYYLQEQLTRLYVVPGVPLDTVFEPQTRNEIRKIQWFYIDQLPSNKRDTGSKDATGFTPNNFFMVMPFVKELKKWIVRRKQSLRAADEATVANVAAAADGSSTQKALRKERSCKELAQQAVVAADATSSQSPTKLRSIVGAAPTAAVSGGGGGGGGGRASSAGMVAASAGERQKQRQYYDEQSQLQFKELLEIRDACGKSQQQQHKGTSFRKELEHGLRVLPKEGSLSSRKPYATLVSLLLLLLLRFQAQLGQHDDDGQAWPEAWGGALECDVALRVGCLLLLQEQQARGAAVAEPLPRRPLSSLFSVLWSELGLREWREGHFWRYEPGVGTRADRRGTLAT